MNRAVSNYLGITQIWRPWWMALSAEDRAMRVRLAAGRCVECGRKPHEFPTSRQSPPLTRMVHADPSACEKANATFATRMDGLARA